MTFLRAFLALLALAGTAVAEPKTGDVILIPRQIMFCDTQAALLTIATAAKEGGTASFKRAALDAFDKDECQGVPGIPFPMAIGEVDYLGELYIERVTRKVFAIETWELGQPDYKVWLFWDEAQPGAGI